MKPVTFARKKPIDWRSLRYRDNTTDRCATRATPLFSLLMLLFLAWASPAAYAQTSPLQRGEELFLNDQMSEALPFLEAAIAQYPRDERIYLYLATAYEVLGQPDKAVTTLQRGVQYASEYLDVMYFNIANNMFKQGKNVIAFEMYTKAITANPEIAEAYLNRANTALRINDLKTATADYEFYLQLQPATTQREPIEQVLGLLRELVEEQRRVAMEQERIRIEEAARRKALLDQVLDSLQNASKSTTNLSAESEEVERVDETSDIVD